MTRLIDRSADFGLECLEPRVLLSNVYLFEAWEEFLPEGAEFFHWGEFDQASNNEAFWLTAHTILPGGDVDTKRVTTEGWVALGDDLIDTFTTPWLNGVQIHDIRGDLALVRDLEAVGNDIVPDEWLLIDMRTGETDPVFTAGMLTADFDPDRVESARFMGPDAMLFGQFRTGIPDEHTNVWLLDGSTFEKILDGLLVDASDAGYVLAQEIYEFTVWRSDTSTVTTLPIDLTNTAALNASGLVVLSAPDGDAWLYDLETDQHELIEQPALPDEPPTAWGTFDPIDFDDSGVALFKHIVRADPLSLTTRTSQWVYEYDTDTGVYRQMYGLVLGAEGSFPGEFGHDGNLYIEDGRLVVAPLSTVLTNLAAFDVAYGEALHLAAPTASNNNIVLMSDGVDVLAKLGLAHLLQGDFEVALTTSPRLYETTAAFYGLIVADGVGSITIFSEASDASRYGRVHYPAAERIASSPFAYTDAVDRATLGGLTDEGELMIFFQPTHDVYGLIAVNLSSMHLAGQGLDTPEYVGGLVGYSTPWGGQNIAGLNADGEIEITWWAPELGELWTTTNISSEIGAPTLVGNISAVCTPSEQISIVGTDADGDAWMFHWAPSYGPGNWQMTNLTEAAEGAALEQGSLTAHVTGWGGLMFAGIEQDTGLVASYWWQAEFDWVYEVLAPDAPAMIGPLSSASSATEQSIVGVSEDGELFRYWWGLGEDGWQVDNLTELAEI